MSATVRVPSTLSRRATSRKRSCCTKEALKTISSMVMALCTGQVMVPAVMHLLPMVNLK